MKNNIPQGYKATALGIIPQEWEVVRFGKVMKCFSGGTPKSSNPDFFGGKIPFIKSGEIHLSTTEQNLSEEGLNQSAAKMVNKGDLLYALYGANSGDCAISKIEGAINQAILCIRTDAFDVPYLLAVLELNRPYYTDVYLQGGQGNLSAEIVKSYMIAVPPLAEQRKIAEVLGVWDEAIEKQARLIEKLALRKRGLMQRLLSAKLRLSGFSEPWKIHKLQELFTERNETNRTDLPLLSITGDRGVILQTESEKRDTSNDDKSKYKRIAKGDIGYNTMRMWQGRSALSGLEGIVSPAYTIVVPNADVDGYYMSVLFKQPRLVYDFWTHSQGLVGDTLNCKYRDFGQVHICCPPLAEQKAITEVLTAADREIELAKEKLERLRRQKRGLMQQLLTGKKRVKY